MLRWKGALLVLALGCDDPDPPLSIDAGGLDGGAAHAERIFATEPWADDCLYASPVRVRSRGADAIFIVGDQGRMALVDVASGAVLWEDAIAHEAEANLLVYSTPAVIGGLLVLGWQVISATTPASRRYRHEVAVFDLEARAFAPEFETLALAAEVPSMDGSGMVRFDSNWQLMRGAILPVAVPDRELGLAYVPVGNGPSEQPFHGWVFEIDLDAWRDGEATDAIANVLLTTRENGCGAPGNRDATVCGGGVWNAAGVQRYDEPDGTYRLLVPTGNGRVDYDIGAYAHSILRVGRGLALETGCDAKACADFDEHDPSHACLASCTDVFSARLPEGEPPLAPEDGTCEGLTFLECYGALDADLGANAPAIVELPSGRVFVQPGKDGALYVIDGEHMGTLHQRLQVMDFCGTPTDVCGAFWIGMFVTQPAVARIDGQPVVIVASVMSDRTHPSGISAFDVLDDPPRLERRWQVPSFDSEAALQVFRHHPGRPIVAEVGGEPYVFVVETRRAATGPSTPPGVLWGVRVRDGDPAIQIPLTDAGQRFSVPLVIDDTIYVDTCASNAEGAGRLEAFRISP
jgi:hypothetical protein